MSLPAQQYAAMRGALRGALSANDPLAANPSDGEVLGFFSQLLTDASGAAAPGASQLAEISIAAARMLTSNNAATQNPNDADVAAFWAQVASDSSGATTLSARRYLAFRAALRGALSANYPGISNPSEANVLGYFSPYAVTPVPISDAYWSTGGWWDLSLISGADGAIFSGSVPPANPSGNGTFTPVQRTGVLPTIYNEAIGGKRGLILSQTSDNALQNNALAGILNGSNKQWTFVVDGQANTVGVTISANNLLAWGSDQPNFVEDVLKATYNVTIGGATAQGMTLAQQTGGGVTVTQNNIAPVLGYDYFRLAATYDGTALATYINGVAVTVTPTTWQSAAMAITRFIWGAWPVSAVPFNGWNGYVRRLGVRQGAASALEIAQIDANMVANDVILPQTDPRTPQFIVAGASVINGQTDEINGMGVRYPLAKYIQDHKLSWQSLGTRVGAFALNKTTSTSGVDSTQIVTQITSTVTARTSLIIVDLGDEEIDLGQTSAQVQTAIANAIAAIRAAAYAVNPQCDIAVNTIVPLSETPLNTVCISVNAALPGIWNNSDAAFPSNRPLIRWDANTAIGGPSYVQANYTAGGNDHPNNQGYTLMGTAMLTAISARLTALSPT